MNANGKIKIENVALVYVELPNSNAEQDMYELQELISTANGEIKLTCSQKRSSVDPSTVVGKGKLEEIKSSLELIDAEIDVVIFSCNLNSTQRATLKKVLQLDVIDKIDLILDIFALRATSAEGKKQVELAQLSYNLATKADGDFSRQGAGIGTRGPGETKIETDKRVARARITHLRAELAEIEKHRAITRKNRENNSIFTVALVGYTNAGKSTLFNRLTRSNIYADDKLFATLDTTVRKISLSNGINALLCDTVGFINQLPHALLNAFKSTLEEAARADLILNVCDVSDINVSNHIEVTEQTLAELSVSSPIVRVYNKCDKISSDAILSETLSSDKSLLFVSALTGKNIDVLLSKISDYALLQYTTVKLKFDHKQAGKLLSLLNKYATDCSVDYCDDFVFARATLSKKFINIFAEYIYFG
ncbi:MAG: GTPase HflX [Corallococcus sp.]|nr:GTPase HflX [Corallococcus sp.]